MVSLAELVPPVEKGLPSDSEDLSVSNTIFDRVRFSRSVPNKVGGGGGASSRNPPTTQISFLQQIEAPPNQLTNRNSGVDAAKEYMRRILDAIHPRKPVEPTYETDIMGGPDSQGNTTKGFGGQVRGGSPPEE